MGSAVNLLGKFGKFLDGRSHLIVSRHDTIVPHLFFSLIFFFLSLPWVVFFVKPPVEKSFSPTTMLSFFWK